MFIIGEDRIAKINEPFWYTEGEAGIKRNPLYTDDGR
jgi:hypothetical protein